MADIPNRKLLVAVLGMVIVSIMRARGWVGDGPFESIMMAAVLGYPAANVAQKLVETRQEKKE